MATGFNIDNLTMNPKEKENFSEFILELAFERPALNALHNVQSGIQMKEQIVFASQYGKTGLKAGADCSRQTSGATSTLTQKYWDPVGIEDTIIHCQKEIDALFKAYYSKIASYKDNYEIQGISDEDIFMALLLQESMYRTIWRASWFGKTDVAAADEDTEGLADASNVKFYDYFDGFFEQIFDGVSATSIAKYTDNSAGGISELNANTTIPTQMTLASGDAVKWFEGVWGVADARLKANPNAKFYVTNAIWENYRQYLQGKGENFTIEYTLEGFQTLKWNGKDVVNMETVWDLDLQADFVDNTTNNAYYIPHRIVLTVPENIPIGTLNENDFDELEIWYNQDERQLKMAFGFSLDAKVLEEYMIAVGY